MVFCVVCSFIYFFIFFYILDNNMGVNSSKTSNTLNFFTDASCNSDVSDTNISKTSASLSQTMDCSENFKNATNVNLGGRMNIKKADGTQITFNIQ